MLCHLYVFLSEFVQSAALDIAVALFSFAFALSYFALDNRQYVVLAQDQVFLSIQFDLGSGVLSEQNAIAFLAVQLLTIASFKLLSRAGGDHFAFLRLLFGGIRNYDAAANLLFFFNSLHDDSVVKRSDVGHDGIGLLSKIVLSAEYRVLSPAT